MSFHLITKMRSCLLSIHKSIILFSFINCSSNLLCMIICSFNILSHLLYVKLVNLKKKLINFFLKGKLKEKSVSGHKSKIHILNFIFLRKLMSKGASEIVNGDVRYIKILSNRINNKKGTKKIELIK